MSPEIEALYREMVRRQRMTGVSRIGIDHAVAAYPSIDQMIDIANLKPKLKEYKHTQGVTVETREIKPSIENQNVTFFITKEKKNKSFNTQEEAEMAAANYISEYKDGSAHYICKIVAVVRPKTTDVEAVDLIETVVAAEKK